MRSGRKIPGGHRPDLIAVAAAALLALAAGIAALPRIEEHRLAQTAAAGRATLRLAAEGVNAALRRHEPMPGLIAERPILKTLLADPTNQGLLPFVNEQLRQTARAIGASDVYLMDRSGRTLAASSYRKPRSFVGEVFDYRPYFQQALRGGTARFHALGTTSGERGFFFAAPVLDGVEVAGVVAVKFTVGALERAWSEGTGEIMVTDVDGIVFMASRPNWRFRALAPLTAAARARIARTRQFPTDRVTVLPTEARPLGTDAALLTVGATEEFVASTLPLDTRGWRATILTPAAPARTEARLILGVWALAVLFLATVIWTLLQRRARINERLAGQRATQELLEARVRERTALLQAEIEERRATEDRLRKTQTDLIQAGKMAALGQMSAALSHEINQPLAAVKSYAENAGTFLDRGRAEDARDNIRRISQMADRVAAISGHLRNFARRPQDRVGPIPVTAVIRDALDLMAPRLRARGAAPAYVPPAAELWAVGGRLRLQQVVVNLIANALDAQEDAAAPMVEIAVARDGDRTVIEVADRGPGLSPDVAGQLFDPFFTTKPPGKGLGLGLSISYNIVEDFGGRLSAENREAGGAVFRIALVSAEARDVAAE